MLAARLFAGVGALTASTAPHGLVAAHRGIISAFRGWRLVARELLWCVDTCRCGVTRACRRVDELRGAVKARASRWRDTLGITRWRCGVVARRAVIGRRVIGRSIVARRVIGRRIVARRIVARRIVARRIVGCRSARRGCVGRVAVSARE